MTLLLLSLFPLSHVSAAEQAFPKTPAGEAEIKTIPASRLIAARGDGAYFDENNRLFRPLFRYIRQHDIAMTTPVEAEIEPGVMYFYLGSDADGHDYVETEGVKYVEIPERTVASIGVRGTYSRANFNAAERELRTWLMEHPEWRPVGAARAVYWNGPFTLGMLKRSEVHLTVEKNG